MLAALTSLTSKLYRSIRGKWELLEPVEWIQAEGLPPACLMDLTVTCRVGASWKQFVEAGEQLLGAGERHRADLGNQAGLLP